MFYSTIYTHYHAIFDALTISQNHLILGISDRDVLFSDVDIMVVVVLLKVRSSRA